MTRDERISIQLKRDAFTSKLRHHERFRDTFLAFHLDTASRDPSRIPFRYILHMHDHVAMIFLYIRQWLAILHVLRTVFGIHHPWMTLDHLFVTKTKHLHDVHMLVLSDDLQIALECPYGYHVFLAGFEDAWFDDRPSPFRCPHPARPWNPIREVAQCLLPKKRRWQRCVRHLDKRTPTLPLADAYPDILGRILPLVSTPRIPGRHHDIRPLHDPCSYDAQTIQHEIRRVFHMFHEEYVKLETMFVRQANLERLLEDWIDQLIAFKHDFFQTPEQTLSILRKVLYQYMVDHKYTHISFKQFDVSRMVVALYTWSQWYERYLQLIVHATFDDENLHEESVRMMACLQLFFERDPLPESLLLEDKTNVTVHFYDFSSHDHHHHHHTSQRVPLSRLLQEFSDVHPMLRSSAMYRTLFPASEK